MAAGSPSTGEMNTWFTWSALARRAQHWARMYRDSALAPYPKPTEMWILSGSGMPICPNRGRKASIAACSHSSRVTGRACAPPSAGPLAWFSISVITRLFNAPF